MDRRIVERLPADARREVCEVEEVIGGEITIAGLTADFALQVGRSDVAVLDSGMIEGQAFARILLPDQTVDFAAITHEVTHAHRNLVQSVWRLEGSGSRNQSIPSRIENDLEHLFIVPRELAWFPDRATHWNREQSDAIRAAVLEQRPHHRRADMLLAWLATVKLTPRLSERKRLEKAYTKSGLLHTANDLVRKIDEAFGDKPKMAAAVIDAVGFDKAAFSMVRYRPDLRRIERISIPNG